MGLTINQLLALEYVKLHATEDMTPEQFAEMYDKVHSVISHRNDAK